MVVTTPVKVTSDTGHFLSWVKKASTYGILAVEAVTLPSLEQTSGGAGAEVGEGTLYRRSVGLPGLVVGVAFWFSMAA